MNLRRRRLPSQQSMDAWVSTRYPFAWRTRLGAWTALGLVGTVAAAAAVWAFDPRPRAVPPLGGLLYATSLLTLTGLTVVCVAIVRRTSVVHTRLQAVRLFGCVSLAMMALLMPQAVLSRGVMSGVARVSFDGVDVGNLLNYKAVETVDAAKAFLAEQTGPLDVPGAMARPFAVFVVAFAFAGAVTAWCALSSTRAHVFRSLRRMNWRRPAALSRLDGELAMHAPIVWASGSTSTVAQLVIVGFLVAKFVQQASSDVDNRVSVLVVTVSIAILMLPIARHQRRFRFLTTLSAQEIRVFLVQALGTALLTGVVLFAGIVRQSPDADRLRWAAGSWGLIAASILAAARHGSPSVIAHVVGILCILIFFPLVGEPRHLGSAIRFVIGLAPLAVAAGVYCGIRRFRAQSRGLMDASFTPLFVLSPLPGLALATHEQFSIFDPGSTADPRPLAVAAGVLLAIGIPVLVLRLTYGVRRSSY